MIWWNNKIFFNRLTFIGDVGQIFQLKVFLCRETAVPDFDRLICAPEVELFGEEDEADMERCDNFIFGFRVNHWGCRATRLSHFALAYSKRYEINNNIIEFGTEYGVPRPAIKRLSERFPTVEIIHEFFCEHGGDIETNELGCNTYKNGQLIMQYTPYELATKKFIKEVTRFTDQQMEEHFNEK